MSESGEVPKTPKDPGQTLRKNRAKRILATYAKPCKNKRTPNQPSSFKTPFRTRRRRRRRSTPLSRKIASSAILVLLLHQQFRKPHPYYLIQISLEVFVLMRVLFPRLDAKGADRHAIGRGNGRRKRRERRGRCVAHFPGREFGFFGLRRGRLGKGVGVVGEAAAVAEPTISRWEIATGRRALETWRRRRRVGKAAFIVQAAASAGPISARNTRHFAGISRVERFEFSSPAGDAKSGQVKKRARPCRHRLLKS